MMNPALHMSGVQIIASAMGHPDYPVTFQKHNHEHCMFCGGPMTDKVFEPTFSSSWRTTYELENKDGTHMCSACAYVTAKNYRQYTLDTALCPYHIFLVGKAFHLSETEFYQFLKDDQLTYPCVMIRCNSFNRSKKNISWKVSRSVTYSRENIVINEVGARLFLQRDVKEGHGEATVSQSLDDYLQNVEAFRELIRGMQKEKLLKNNKKKNAQKIVRFLLFKNIMTMLQKTGRYTVENLEALYLAMELELPNEVKIQKLLVRRGKGHEA